MKKNRRILHLIISLSFYSYFTVWSLLFFNFAGEENYQNNPRNDEVYLLSAQINSLAFSESIEGKKLKNSEDSTFRNHPGKYLGSFNIQLFRPAGSFHSIYPFSIQPVTVLNSFVDHPRPPPAASPNHFI